MDRSETNSEAPRVRQFMVTERCLVEDLEIDRSAIETPLPVLAETHPIVKALLERRGQLPVGGETINGLTSNIVAFSLHSGRWRGATWHQKSADVVWLLASKWHESGAMDDAYPEFLSLDANDQLIPTPKDVDRAIDMRVQDVANAFVNEVPELLELATATPGALHIRTLGKRVIVRFATDRHDPRIMTVAVSHKLANYEDPLPDSWVMRTHAAFFRGTPLEELTLAQTVGDQPVRDDETAYEHYLDPANR